MFGTSPDAPRSERRALSPTVRPVEGRRDFTTFVDVPWRLFDRASHPQWVPPLRMSVSGVLDPKNPFFENADVQLFLAERDGEARGRVAAIEIRTTPEDEPGGFFGFFECPDDPDLAAALLDAAEAWLGARGHEIVRGPVHPSTNYEAGLLVDGFEHRPTFMTPWNPPFYESLLDARGYGGVMDLLGWHLHLAGVQEKLQTRFRRIAEKIRERGGYTLGELDLADFEVTMRRCWQVYVEAWRGNWGFCPLPFEEFLYIASELKPLLVREGTVGVEHDGELIGFGLFVPDYNRVLIDNRNGRLFPLGWWRLLRAKRRTPWVRTMLTGILPDHQRQGALPLLLFEAIRKAPSFGVEDVEFSWVLETNEEANQALRKTGATVYRTWRIFEKRL